MAARRYSTSDVPQREALAYWQDLICQVFINLDCDTSGDPAFAGQIESGKVGEIELSSMRAGGMRLQRTRSHVGRARDDHFLIVQQTAGTMRAEQDGRQCTLHAGDCALFDSARPYVATLDDSFGHIVVKVPRTLMRSRFGPLEAYSVVPISGQRGVGRVASRFLQSLPDAIAEMEPASAARMAGVGLELMATALSEVRAPGSGGGTSTTVTRRILIKDHIERHLHDPDLSLHSVAEAVGLSTRYLSELFEREGTPVVKHIWTRRLERCHALLSDPAQASRSISSIAYSVGFNNMSHFSRSFKAHFGKGPSEVRSSLKRL